MPSSLEHLRTFSERPHMSTEQRKAAKVAAARRGANVWSIAGAPKRGAMRALIIHVCRHPPMTTSMKAHRTASAFKILLYLFPFIFFSPSLFNMSKLFGADLRSTVQPDGIPAASYRIASVLSRIVPRLSQNISVLSRIVPRLSRDDSMPM